MERLPGLERPCLKASLETGYVCISVLLVGLQSPADRWAGQDKYYPSVNLEGKGQNEAPGILVEGFEGSEGVAKAVDYALVLLGSSSPHHGS
jgi:hypothetical protein